MRFVKPLDEELVLRLAREHDLLVTVEENTIQGGAGSAVAECLTRHGMTVALLHLGLPDDFLEQGEPAKMLAACGLDAAGVVGAIRQAAPALGMTSIVSTFPFKGKNASEGTVGVG